MLLSDLLNNAFTIQVTGSPELVEVKSLSLNSKEVQKGTIFFAIKGYKVDGHKFIVDAVSNGASAVVIEDDSKSLDELLKINSVVKIVVKNSRSALSSFSNVFYGAPSKKINLVGITGTKGKTTTSYYLKNIFESVGLKSGLIGTNKNMIGNNEIPTKLTTPEANIINSLMSEMIIENCKNCVMEVSSHSLELSRVADLDFNVGVFTNITSDHLDFHSNFENYLKAKKILFDQLSENAVAVYNKDDGNSEKLIQNSKAKSISYAANSDANFLMSNIEYSLDGTNFNLTYLNQTYEVSTSLIGIFNAYNATAAIGAAVFSGVKIEDAIKGIYSTPQVSGRFEVISSGNKKVIVDYSHTAGSLEEALKAIKHIVGEDRKITTVFGCGGDRDKSKRPIMGSIAEVNSDHVIITSDNPRTEDPYKIIDDIIAGLKKENHKIIEDREEAIKSAIIEADDNSVILIAGKGHETYQEINGIRNYFSDKEVAEKYL